MSVMLTRLREVAEEQGFLFLATGFDPLRSHDERQWIMKRRYRAMRGVLAHRGARAW